MQDAEILGVFVYKQQIGAIIHSAIEFVCRVNFVICMDEIYFCFKEFRAPQYRSRSRSRGNRARSSSKGGGGG